VAVLGVPLPLLVVVSYVLVCWVVIFFSVSLFFLLCALGWSRSVWLYQGLVITAFFLMKYELRRVREKYLVSPLSVFSVMMNPVYPKVTFLHIYSKFAWFLS
jgi:hypothetical protein